MSAEESALLREQLARSRDLLEECVFVIEGHCKDYHFRTPPDLIERLREAIRDLASLQKLHDEET
jgi:hypothetical protein